MSFARAHGPAAPARRDRDVDAVSPDRESRTTHAIADTADQTQRQLAEHLEAMHAAADRETWLAAKQACEVAIGELERLRMHARDLATTRRLGDAIEQARAQLAVAPQQPRARVPVLEAEPALLAALPVDAPVGANARATYDAAEQAVAGVFRSLSRTDVTALRELFDHHPDHAVARRFQRFASERRHRLLAILGDPKTRAAARELPHRAQMERAFGRALPQVEVHVGAEATAACEELGAAAYTVGEQVVFRDDSPSVELVAHELAHAVQQTSATGTGTASHEADADRVAAGAASGRSVEHLVSRMSAAPRAAQLKKPHDLTRDELVTASAPAGGSSGLLDDTQVKSAIAWNTSEWEGEQRAHILDYLRGGAGGDARFTVEDVQTVAELQHGAGLELDEVSGWLGDKTMAILLNAGLPHFAAPARKSVRARDVKLNFYPGEFEDIEAWKAAKARAATEAGGDLGDDEFAATAPPDGVGKLYVEHLDKIVAVLDVRGGPPIRLQDGPDHVASPTTAGEYTLGDGHAHTTPVWRNSQIPWGAPIRRHRKTKRIQFRDNGKWWDATRKNEKIRKPIPEDEFLDENGELVTEWRKNDFGPMSWNLKRKNKRTSMYLHTSPDDETTAEVDGVDPDLSCSHGCLHLKPSQRDFMIESGFFQKKVKISVKKYSAHFLPQAMRDQMTR